MVAPITPVSVPRLIEPLASPAASAAGPDGFQKFLTSAMQNVQHSGAAANSAVQNYLSGGNQELHSTILATQSADLDFELLLQVRNKVVSAYEEIMKMQI